MKVSSSDQRRAFFNQLSVKRMRDVRRHRLYYKDREHWLCSLMRRDCSVIELGCGTGPTLEKLPQKKKTGIDFSPEMIRLAKEHDSYTQYFLEDIEQLSHREKYDYVLLLDTINYVSDVQRVLQRARENLCHRRTRIVITYYNFLWQPLFMIGEFFRWKTRFPEQNWLNRGDVSNLLSLTGFEIVEHGGRILIPIKIPFLSGFFNRFLASLPLLRSLCLVRYVIARPSFSGRSEYSVTVLSAVRNEKGNIRKIVDSMPLMGNETELLFIEGHSTDGTWEEMQQVKAQYKGPLLLKMIQQPGMGKADALHAGAAVSRGDIIMIYDGDFTVHPFDLQKLYDVLAEGRGEIVNACRLTYPLQEGAMRFLNLIGNRMFSLLFSWLFSQTIVDPLSPVKAFFREDYKHMTSRRDPFGDFDFFIGASAQQLKMREIPIHYLERSYGTTKIRRFHHAWILFHLFMHGALQRKWV